MKWLILKFMGYSFIWSKHYEGWHWYGCGTTRPEFFSTKRKAVQDCWECVI